MNGEAGYMVDKIKIMDVEFSTLNKSELYSGILHPALEKEEKQFIVTANPEIVMLAKEDKKYRTAIEDADYIIPDGSGIILASKIIGEPLPERIPGFEVMTDLLKHAESNQLSCYFLGASKLVNDKMLENIKRLYPDLIVAGNHHGFFDTDDPRVAEEVLQARADIIFVALGIPRQEIWISKHMDKFEKGLFIGVGGSFDVIAGEVKRAPQLWIRLNLEWLYRLIKQPFRWKRMLKVFEFIIRIIIRKY